MVRKCWAMQRKYPGYIVINRYIGNNNLVKPVSHPMVGLYPNGLKNKLFPIGFNCTTDMIFLSPRVKFNFPILPFLSLFKR